MRPMCILRIVAAVLVFAIVATAQPLTEETKSPKAVVENFWKMDTEGGRLTDDGWRAAASFFIRPTEPTKDKIICVIDYGFTVSEPRIKDETAEVIVNTAGAVWKIDRKMRLSVCSDQGKDFWVNRLMLTGQRWEFAPDHRTLKEVSGPPEWRFEKPGNIIFLTLGVAIRYLSQVRDTTTDPVIKKNAERSLTTLKRHHSLKRHH